MEVLTQTISNLVGILLGVVGAVGVGFFIYGARVDRRRVVCHGWSAIGESDESKRFPPWA